MSDHLSRAHTIAGEIDPFAKKLEVVSVEPGHYIFKIWRKVGCLPSAHFGDGVTNYYPFDAWASRQGFITWTNAGPTHWLGRLEDKTQITIIAEE